MALFLTILEGETAEQAEPLFATRDDRLIRVVSNELAKRLGMSAPKSLLEFQKKQRSQPVRDSTL